MKTYEKKPDEVLDYGFDWSKEFPDDPVQTSTWVIDAGLTTHDLTHDASSTTFWASGGMLRARYYAVNRVTTVGGRTASRDMLIEIVKRRG